METKVKIKIQDVNFLRKKLDDIYEQTTQILLAKWALLVAKHILNISDIDITNINTIQEGFNTNELWQVGNKGVYDVRKASFKVHKLARECSDDLKMNAFRVVGHAIATGHIREHAMVASDYAIKTINIMYPNDNDAVEKERQWQIYTLTNIK